MASRDLTVGRLPWDAADPYPFYAQRRLAGNVVWDCEIGAWLVLGYEAAKQILGGPGWTSNPQANPNAPRAIRALDPEMLRRNILTVDGADHHRLRGAVRDVFTRSFITGLTAGVEAIASETIDHIPAGAEFDFMADVALPIPIAVAAAWLGLDVDSSRLLGEESPAISRMLGDFVDPAAVEGGTAAFATLLTELLPLAADRRHHPGDDLLSFLGADPDLELDDVVTMALIIAVAGHETTANLLGAAIIRLLTPSSDGDRPVVTAETIDGRLCTELLRLDGPVQAVGRTATCDHIIDGVTIRATEAVLVVLAAGNRDPAVFSRPDRLQFHRAGPAPLAFGYGAHYCLGAALARLEMGVALQKVLSRRLSLSGSPVWRDTPAIRGPLTIPAVFS
ncbi:cytochrome P450 [Mycolicibacterium mengxianglii]|uniref:cytochrome P450 n=1 Tax=Mycolicibacterium mengxianglii TaxID=2736649 RepID=UPI0018EF33DA|nr:cytochrome P450 [Mycolicibacterium mengxianglii]